VKSPSSGSQDTNLPEHDAVNLATKQATSLPRITDNSLLPATDFKNHFRQLILRKWNLLWKKQTNNKLLAIKQVLIQWSSSARNSRREEVTSRLKIGHTRLTHSYLLDRHFISGPTCSHCPAEHPTVNCFFSCKQLRSLRTLHNVQSSIPLAFRKQLKHSLQYPFKKPQNSYVSCNCLNN